MTFCGSRATPSSRAEMSGVVFRAARGMATRAASVSSLPALGSAFRGQKTPGHNGVSPLMTFARGVSASSASSGDFGGAPPRIVSGGGRGKGGKGGVVWVPSTAGVGGSARGRLFETAAGYAGAGAGAPSSPPQPRGNPYPQQSRGASPPQRQLQPRSTQSGSNPYGSGNDANQPSGTFSPSASAPGPRTYCDFAVYKSKAAVKFGVIKPTFEAIPNSPGSRQKKRDGGVLLEFAPAVGQRQYDWQNAKQSILLSPLELVELTESLAVLGKGVNFFHDPGMGTARQGAVTKNLKAEPMPDGSGGVFLNLSTSSGAKLNVAVSFAEFCLLRSLAQYLVPRLTGFDEVFKD